MQEETTHPGSFPKPTNDNQVCKVWIHPESPGYDFIIILLYSISRNHTGATIYDEKVFDSVSASVQTPVLPNQNEHGRISSQPKRLSEGKGIDWKVANNLADEKMLRYIQKCSMDYAKELDKTFPD